MTLKQKRVVFRSTLLRLIRHFFWENGFIEVDTPVRLPRLLPERYIIPIESDGFFLQTSPEICMKRMLASGFSAIFQICHCFRKNERGSRHLEEFTMLEWYRLDADYSHLMLDCENLLSFVTKALTETDDFLPDVASTVDMCRQKWANGAAKMTVAEAFHRFCPISLPQALAEQRFDEMLVEYIEPHLGREHPLILHDYPVELASLAKISEDGRYAERFELYVDGIELANGFSELTDPTEQRERFSSAVDEITRQEQRHAEIPETFLTELAMIDTAAGIALGVDRLCMVLSGEKDIKNVVNFSSESL